MSDPRPSTAPTEVPGVAAGPPSDGQIDLPPAPGRAVDKIPRVFGRYRILDRLGKGGMGAVFRAHDTQLDRTVALKVPFLSENDTEMRQRFYREARAAAALHHPNICPVYDVGELHGVPYLTMAFIEGRSLAQALESGPPFTPQQTALVVRKVALAMQEAHAKGIVHRDLKPANILIRPNGDPVVMDFGLARRADDRRGEGLTRKGDVLGTLEYMPPEQLDGDSAAVGPVADIYALGVVLYELLTGRRPFSGTTVSMLTAILLKPPARPSEVRPGVPERLEEICLKAMARQPADRYPTMAQFAAALSEYLRSPQQAAAPAAAPPAEPAPAKAPGSTKPIKAEATPRPVHRVDAPAPAAEEAPAPPPTPKSSPKRPRSGAKHKKAKKKSQVPLIVGGGLAAAVLVGVVVAVLATRNRGEPVSREEPSAQSPSPASTPPPEPAPKANETPAPPPAGKDATKNAGKKAAAKSDPQPPGAKKEPARTALAVRLQPDTLALAVGEQRDVTVKVDRGGYQGPITLRWTGPKELRVTPAGPVTLQPNEPDPVLKVRLMAQGSAGDPRLEVIATPAKDSGRDPVTGRLALRVNPGPCVQILDVADQPNLVVEAVAFAPDASLALVGGGGPPRKDAGKEPGKGATGPGGPGTATQALDPNAVRVWNLTQGEPLVPLVGHADRVTGLSVSADGKTALSVSTDGTVALWDLTRGRRESQSPRQPLRVLAVGMSPDAKRALVVYPGQVMKVDLEKFRAFGQPIKTAQLTGSEADDAIRTAAVSAKGQGLLAGLDGKVFLLDLTDKTKPKPLDGHREAVLCAAFSPAGDLAATGGGGLLKVGTLQPGQENIVCLWDVGTAELRWKAAGHSRSVVCVAFSPDGKFLASGGADGEVRVWEVETGKPVATFTGHAGRVLGLVFTPDATGVWSAGVDRTLRQWRLP